VRDITAEELARPHNPLNKLPYRDEKLIMRHCRVTEQGDVDVPVIRYTWVYKLILENRRLKRKIKEAGK
jgi:hypothetical protein